MSSETAWLNQPYREMSVGDLFAAFKYWSESVDSASGWASAHYSALQLAAICTEGDRRRLNLNNPYPIIGGGVD